MLDLAGEHPDEPRQRRRLLLDQAPVAIEAVVQRAGGELLARPPVREPVRQGPERHPQDPLRDVVVAVAGHHLGGVERLGERELLVVVPDAVAPRERDLLGEHAELRVEHPLLGDDVLRPVREARVPEALDDASRRGVRPRVGLQVARRRRTVEPAGVDVREAAGRDRVADRGAVVRAAGAEEQPSRLAGDQPVPGLREAPRRRRQADDRACLRAPCVHGEMDEADRRGRAVHAPDERLLPVLDTGPVDVRGLEDRQVAVGELRRGEPREAGAVPLVPGRADGDGEAGAADPSRDDLAAVRDVEGVDLDVHAEREREREVVDARRGQGAPAAPLRIEQRREVAARSLVRRPVRGGEQPLAAEIALREQRPPDSPRVRGCRLRRRAGDRGRLHRPGRPAHGEPEERPGRGDGGDHTESLRDSSHGRGADGRYMPIAW